MINALKLIDETMRHIIATALFTTGERAMLLDIFNATALDPVTIQSGAGLDAQVRDSFDLYPGMYEEKWKAEKTPMLEKIAALSDWQSACIVIWAVDFWQSGAYEETDAINRYITGKLSALTRLNDARSDLTRAIDLMEKTKGAFKSPAIAEARTKTEHAADILTKSLDF